MLNTAGYLISQCCQQIHPSCCATQPQRIHPSMKHPASTHSMHIQHRCGQNCYQQCSLSTERVQCCVHSCLANLLKCSMIWTRLFTASIRIPQSVAAFCVRGCDKAARNCCMNPSRCGWMRSFACCWWCPDITPRLEMKVWMMARAWRFMWSPSESGRSAICFSSGSSAGRTWIDGSKDETIQP